MNLRHPLHVRFSIKKFSAPNLVLKSLIFLSTISFTDNLLISLKVFVDEIFNPNPLAIRFK